MTPGFVCDLTKLLQLRAMAVEDTGDASECQHLRLGPLFLGRVARVMHQDVFFVRVVSAPRRDRRQFLHIVQKREQYLRQQGDGCVEKGN